MLAAVLAINAFAQDPEIRKGYIGVCFGAAFPVEDIDNDAISEATQTNIANFGYLFSPHIGIAATWFRTIFVPKLDDEMSSGLGGLLIGPLFSVPTPSCKVQFDFIPMIGFGRGTLPTHEGPWTYSKSTDFAAGLKGAVRWNCGRRISVSGGLNYYYGKPENVNLSSFAIMFGVNYRIK